MIEVRFLIHQVEFCLLECYVFLILTNCVIIVRGRSIFIINGVDILSVLSVIFKNGVIVGGIIGLHQNVIILRILSVVIRNSVIIVKVLSLVIKRSVIVRVLSVAIKRGVIVVRVLSLVIKKSVIVRVLSPVIKINVIIVRVLSFAIKSKVIIVRVFSVIKSKVIIVKILSVVIKNRVIIVKALSVVNKNSVIGLNKGSLVKFFTLSFNSLCDVIYPYLWFAILNNWFYIIFYLDSMQNVTELFTENKILKGPMASQCVKSIHSLIIWFLILTDERNEYFLLNNKWIV